jgi:hypothetical protein
MELVNRKPMNELQVKLFDYLRKERNFSKKEAKRLCRDLKITSFEDWVVHYENIGRPIPFQRTRGFLDGYPEYCYNNVEDNIFYSSEDEDCNDHFFTICDGISKGIVYPNNEEQFSSE